MNTKAIKTGTCHEMLNQRQAWVPHNVDLSEYLDDGESDIAHPWLLSEGVGYQFEFQGTRYQLIEEYKLYRVSESGKETLLMMCCWDIDHGEVEIIHITCKC
jgi:hypothetical protein